MEDLPLVHCLCRASICRFSDNAIFFTIFLRPIDAYLHARPPSLFQIALKFEAMLFYIVYLKR